MKPNLKLVGNSFFLLGMALICYLLIQNNGVPYNSLLYNLIEAFGFVFAILGWLILMITPKTKKTPT